MVSLQTKVTLRRPCVLVKKLPIRSICTKTSDDNASNRGLLSYASHGNSSDSASDRRSSNVNHRSSSDISSSNSDSETETALSGTGADLDSNSSAAMNWEQHKKTRKESLVSVGSSASPGGFETPVQLPAAADKPNPKEARVMASIARKKRFLAATSSDDSSCSFLSLKKPSQVKITKRPQSFASPEIPRATCRHASLVNQTLCNRTNLSGGTASVPPAPPSPSGAQMSCRESMPQVVTSLLEKMGPDLVKHLGEWINDWTHEKGDDGGNAVAVPTSIASSEPLLSSKQSTTVTNGMVTQSVSRRTLRPNCRRQVKKRKMAAIEEGSEFLSNFVSDYVSDTESESPLEKSGPLHGLDRTLR